MLLERAEVVHLGPVAKVRGQELGTPALARQDRLGAKTCVLAAERRRERADRGVPTCADPLMRKLPSAGTELLDGVVGQQRCVPDGDVDDRNHEKRAVAGDEELDDSCFGRLAEIDHRARGDGLSHVGGPARTEQVHDDYRVVDASSGGNREHDRIAKEGVGKMIEHVGLVLFLSGR